MKKAIIIIFSLVLSSCLFTGCNADEKEQDALTEVSRTASRYEKLPDDIKKRISKTDKYPPVMHTDEFDAPIPLPGPINTSGGEDSPFVLPDSSSMYFFFTPDVRVPHEEQLTDGVTGIWVSQKSGNGGWSEPERVWLEQPEKLSLDGAPFVRDNEIWFASAREGYTGMNIFTAKKTGGKWADWAWIGERLGDELEVGELHIWEDELYYHSRREGGKGGMDIWMTRLEDGNWSDAVNIGTINTEAFEGYPFISSDGREMWFTRTHEGTPAVFRSRLSEGVWQEPELIVSQFAGEPALDDEGNLYFVHHFYEDGEMIEADIYVAYKNTGE